MFKTKDLISLFTNPLNIIVFLSIAFLLGLYIAWIYKKNSKSVSYSQSFVTTLVLLTPVITLIIMFISNNIARAIGVFGAFSVIRFRNAVKDAKDMFYIFWVLATGLVLGIGDVASAVVATLLVSLMANFLSSTNFGKLNEYDYLVIYVLDTTKSDINKVSTELSEFTKKQEIMNVQSAKDGKEIEITSSILIKKDVSVDDIISKLNKNKAIKSLSVNPAKFDLEY